MAPASLPHPVGVFQQQVAAGFIQLTLKHTVTIFPNISTVTGGYYRDVGEVLNRIKEGKHKDTILFLREEREKKVRDKIKQQLPSICFSGTFIRRGVNGLKKHSGLICLDFDGYESGEHLDNDRKKLIQDRYTFSLFTSPSGNGLKVIVKIPPCSPLEHKGFFKALQAHYNNKHWDKGCSDVSRVCYESYDPDIYINERSDIWIERIDEAPDTPGGDNDPLLPIKDIDEITGRLIKWFKDKYGARKGERNNNLYKLAAAFNDFGVHKDESERLLIPFAEQDFTEVEIQSLLRSAYRKTSSFGSKKFENSFAKEKIERAVRDGVTIDKIRKEVKDYSPEEIQKVIESGVGSDPITEFWRYTDSGKLKLVPHLYKGYLEQEGYSKHYPAGADNFIFIKKTGNIVDNASSSFIKDDILHYLYTGFNFGISPYDHMADNPKYFDDKYLSLLGTTSIDFRRDSYDKGYLYYKNGVVEVTSKGIKLIDYVDFSSYVWKKQIIDRSFVKTDYTYCTYEKFISRIAGDNEQRMRSFMSTIGYLLHSYKHASKNYAIILNDEMISEEPNGGSGKGIFCNAISKIKKTATLDGKHFDFGKAFPYQTVAVDTQLLVFDDVKKNFKFENLFSLVTEGITLEKKNKDAIKLDIRHSPKIAITTNYTIGGSGGSFDRRKREIELSSYFNSSRTPYDEFGHEMFDDWDDKEWQRFDSFMITCLQYYLREGLISHDFTNLEKRKFIKHTSFEFLEWCEDDNLPSLEKLDKQELYNRFIEDYPDLKKWLTQRKFTAWMIAWGEYNKKKVSTGKTGGVRWIYFE